MFTISFSNTFDTYENFYLIDSLDYTPLGIPPYHTFYRRFNVAVRRFVPPNFINVFARHHGVDISTPGIFDLRFKIYNERLKKIILLTMHSLMIKPKY
jgi:hypothetical protein